MVINALRHDDLPLSSIGHLVKTKDTKSIVGSLQNHFFAHTRRQSNVVAHALAKRVMFSFPLLVQMEFIPPSIHSILDSVFVVAEENHADLFPMSSRKYLFMIIYLTKKQVK